MKESKQNKIKISHKISMEKWKKNLRRNCQWKVFKPLQPSSMSLQATHMFLCYYLLCCLIKRVFILKTAILCEDIANTSQMKDTLCICNFILLNTNNKHPFLLIYNFLLVSATAMWLREQQFELLWQLDEQINLEQHGTIAYLWLKLKASV